MDKKYLISIIASVVIVITGCVILVYTATDKDNRKSETEKNTEISAFVRADNETVSWKQAYMDYLVNKSTMTLDSNDPMFDVYKDSISGCDFYVNHISEEYTDYPYVILNDMDNDNIPELLICTGSCSADTTVHVFKYDGNEIIYSGNTGERGRSFCETESTDYPGLFGMTTGINFRQVYYYCIEDDKITEEYVYGYISDENTVWEKTDNEEMLDVFLKVKGSQEDTIGFTNEIAYTPWNEIDSQTWNSFCEKYGY